MQRLVGLSRLIAPAALFAIALPAVAQEPAPQREYPAPASSVPEPGDPVARRERLNSEEAAAAQAQVAGNEASAAQHQVAVSLNAMQESHDDAAYAAALAHHDLAEREYRAQRREWERTNPACWKGDAIRCPADPTAPGS